MHPSSSITASHGHLQICRVKRSRIGDFRGGSLEQLRPWLGPGPPWDCRAAQSHQACPEEAQGASWPAKEDVQGTAASKEATVK